MDALGVGGGLGRGEAPVWEGFLTFWGCDGQTAERTGPDQVGVAGWGPGSAPPTQPPGMLSPL